MDNTEAMLYIVGVVVATEVPPNAPIEEFKAVTDVIRNRTNRSGDAGDMVLVVLAKNQFSAVCREAYWRRAMAGKWISSHVDKCIELVKTDWEDTTDGATYYYSPISMEPRGSIPSWATKFEEKQVAGVRSDYFRFYKGEYIL